MSRFTSMRKGLVNSYEPSDGILRDFKRHPLATLETRLQRSLMSVVLNPFALKAFVINKSNYFTIGIVRWGQEFGLLTIAPNGDYVRVNGSIKERLNPDDVKAAILRTNDCRDLPHPRDKTAMNF